MFVRTIGILLLALTGSRLEAKSQSAHDFLVNPEMPGVFVTFERTIVGQRPVFEGESTSRILLKLHNNYRFPITVATFDLGDGGIGVTYEIGSTDQRSNKEIPRGYSEEVLTTQEVIPGGDLSFSVPANHLSPSLYLRIPFEFEAESRATRGGPAPQHFAVFYGISLPSSKQ